MKNSLLKIFLVFFINSLALGGAFMEYFHGWTESENVRLEWKTSEENNLRHFIIERKTPQTSYIEIATIKPKGSNSIYTYIDETAYKTTDLIFVYRIKIVDNSDVGSYSMELSVTPSISGVKRTWGSIKAMFR